MRYAFLCLFTLGIASSSLGQTSKFLPNDGAPTDRFGSSVALSGDYLVVGAPQADGLTVNSGAVYIFSISTGQQLAKLPGPDADTYSFGESVSLDPQRLLIGAPGTAGKGAAYLYTVSSWQQLARMDPLQSAASPDYFGQGVAIRGGFAIVGFPGEDTSVGSAYLYSIPSLQLLARLQDDLPNELGEFGWATAMDESYFLIGSPGDWESGDVASGSATLYSLPNGAPLLELEPTAGGPNPAFGTSVAMDGGYALIGCPGDNVDGAFSGSAYLFSLPGGQELSKLLPSDGVEYRRFGESVAIRGGIAVVGAPWGHNFGFFEGAAYLFSVPDGVELGRFSPSDGFGGNRFGFAAAAANDQVFVGARGDDDNGPGSGSLYAWDIATLPGGVEPLCSGTACPCGNDGQDGVQGCANSVGSGATLEVAGGHPLVDADSLVLTTTGLPPGVMCVPFMGDTQVAAVPLGDGLRCAGGSLYRFPVQAASAQGTLSLGPGIVQQSCTTLPAGACISPGDQRYFQTWYRDPGGPCAFQANVSSALVMTFGL